MTWEEFQNRHEFTSSIMARNGTLTEEEIAKVRKYCENVDMEISPERTQVWLGGTMSTVVEVLDQLNALGSMD